MLDFYSCADCGRCSDHCPANAVGRPLSPRFISIKARDLMFKNYPLSGEIYKSKLLVEDIYTEDEIWSCTTCGPVRKNVHWPLNTLTRWWICAGEWWMRAWCPSPCKNL
jgi:Fe-S oxidoreductase